MAEEMNKCKHCGVFVPAEKAFCPNCSEPMEPEETSNRAHSFSSDMLATIRDDPEKYRQMLMPPVKKQQAASAEAEAEKAAPAAPDSARPASPVASFSYPDAASIPTPAPAPKSNKGLIVGISAVVILILLFVILYVLKVI